MTPDPLSDAEIELYWAFYEEHGDGTLHSDEYLAALRDLQYEYESSIGPPRNGSFNETCDTDW